MLLTADIVNNLNADRPLIGRTAPNFRPKPDRREAVKPRNRKQERDREREPAEDRSTGEELDTYV